MWSCQVWREEGTRADWEVRDAQWRLDRKILTLENQTRRGEAEAKVRNAR